MSLSEVIVTGTLRPDGLVELDEKPGLSPGRVEVALRSLPRAGSPPVESLVDFVRRVRRESEGRGHQFMTEEEITAWRDEQRADDDRVEDAYRQANSPGPRPE